MQNFFRWACPSLGFLFALVLLSPHLSVKDKVYGQQNAPVRPAIEMVQRLGGHLFFGRGEVVEIVLNQTAVQDADLQHISGLSQLTDLSLEATGIGDAGLVHTARLKNLVWLNLYRTQVSDASLEQLRQL